MTEAPCTTDRHTHTSEVLELDRVCSGLTGLTSKRGEGGTRFHSVRCMSVGVDVGMGNTLRLIGWGNREHVVLVLPSHSSHLPNLDPAWLGEKSRLGWYYRSMYVLHMQA